MRLIVIALLALVGCSNQGEQAADRYAMVERNGGSDAEKCAAAQEVEAAHLKSGDESEYQRWKLKAGLDCLNADLPDYGGSRDLGDNLTAVE